MKLVYLAGFGLPSEWAHGIQTVKMCEAFADSEIEVELVLPKRRNELRVDLFKYYGSRKNFKIKKLPCVDLRPGSSRGFYFWLRLISFLLSARIYLLFRKFDVLYTRDASAGLFFKNLFLEIHSLPPAPKKWQIRIWQKAKALIVLTSAIKKELMDFGISEDKIIIAPDGVNLEEFDIKVSKEEAREKLNLPQGRKIVMYSGSLYLHDWKGIDVLLEAAKYFPDNYSVVLVGGNKEEVEKIEKSRGSDKPILVGRKAPGEIPHYLKAADVLVLPNKKGDADSEKYTSPLKLFEYMASRRPIVASNLPSIREILNEHNAILVEPNSAEKLAEGIKSALENPGLSDKISRQAFQDAQNYTWEKRAKNIINFIIK